jgi:hypothetical protein
MEACSAVGAEDVFSIKAHHFAVRAISLASRVVIVALGVDKLPRQLHVARSGTCCNTGLVH